MAQSKWDTIVRLYSFNKVTNAKIAAFLKNGNIPAVTYACLFTGSAGKKLLVCSPVETRKRRVESMFRWEHQEARKYFGSGLIGFGLSGGRILSRDNPRK